MNMIVHDMIKSLWLMMPQTRFSFILLSTAKHE